MKASGAYQGERRQKEAAQQQLDRARRSRMLILDMVGEMLLSVCGDMEHAVSSEVFNPLRSHEDFKAVFGELRQRVKAARIGG